MLVETVLSMLTLVCHFERVMHRVGLFSGAACVHHGRLQCVGPVAWPTAQYVWLRAPLHS
jgi:hypothetical protein